MGSGGVCEAGENRVARKQDSQGNSPKPGETETSFATLQNIFQ